MPYELVITRNNAESATRHETRSSWVQTTITMYFHAGKEQTHVHEKGQNHCEEKSDSQSTGYETQNEIDTHSDNGKEILILCLPN